VLQESQHNPEPRLEEIIEIRDPAVDVEAVMNQIRANIRKRRMKAETGDLDLESFVGGLNSGQITSFGHDTDHSLRRLSATYNKINVGLALTASQVPVLGPLWQKVRRSLHHLVLFYVNMAASKQVVFNKQVVYMFISLIKGLAEENERMKAEVNTLQARVAALEAVLEHRESE